ncbi:MAG TPA: hypothetical protein VGM62_05420 [Chthoniobacterales bacterium]
MALTRGSAAVSPWGHTTDGSAGVIEQFATKWLNWQVDRAVPCSMVAHSSEAAQFCACGERVNIARRSGRSTFVPWDILP